MNIFHLSLAALMLVTGSINTLSVKWADTMSSMSTDGKIRGFDHPFLQACGMFFGEMMCMVAFFIVRYYRKRRQTEEESAVDPFTRPRNFNPFVFFPPAMCDMTATSVQYIGLTLTYASSFQMLRGAVIIFTGILSRVALKRKLKWYSWLGIAFVILGLITVGICDMIYKKKPETDQSFLSYSQNKSSSDILVGDILIVCAQVIVATQMVYEEKFITKYNVPALQAVGWEGTFGFLTLSTLLVPMYFIPVGPKFGKNPRHVLEDAYDGFYQLAHNSLLLTAFCGTAVSIAFFNFAGISVTKEMSATTRMVLDSVRTLVIWTVSLSVKWQTFHWLQLGGFAILVVGMFVYNDLVFRPLILKGLYHLGLIGPPYADLEVDEEEDNVSSNSQEVEPDSTLFETRES